MTKRKPKYKVTLLEAQRRRLEALDRWFQFIKGELAVSPEKFGDMLLFPTFSSLSGIGAGYELIDENVDVEEVRQLIVNGLEKLIDEGLWVLSLDRVEISITPHGPSYAANAPVLGQLAIAQLLRTEEWRAARCAWCGDLFLKKKRGEYCSLNHSQRMRTFRTRNPRWKRLLKDAAKAKFPVAAWLSEPRITVDCPGWDSTHRVETLARPFPNWIQCPKCGMGILVDPPKTKSIEAK